MTIGPVRLDFIMANQSKYKIESDDRFVSTVLRGRRVYVVFFKIKKAFKSKDEWNKSDQNRQDWDDGVRTPIFDMVKDFGDISSLSLGIGNDHFFVYFKNKNAVARILQAADGNGIFEVNLIMYYENMGRNPTVETVLINAHKYKPNHNYSKREVEEQRNLNLCNDRSKRSDEDQAKADAMKLHKELQKYRAKPFSISFDSPYNDELDRLNFFSPETRKRFLRWSYYHQAQLKFICKILHFIQPNPDDHIEGLFVRLNEFTPPSWSTEFIYKPSPPEEDILNDIIIVDEFDKWLNRLNP